MITLSGRRCTILANCASELLAWPSRMCQQELLQDKRRIPSKAISQIKRRQKSILYQRQIQQRIILKSQSFFFQIKEKPGTFSHNFTSKFQFGNAFWEIYESGDTLLTATVTRIRIWIAPISQKKKKNRFIFSVSSWARAGGVGVWGEVDESYLLKVGFIWKLKRWWRSPSMLLF